MTCGNVDDTNLLALLFETDNQKWWNRLSWNSKKKYWLFSMFDGLLDENPKALQLILLISISIR